MGAPDRDPDRDPAATLAALSICEALVVALMEKGLLDQDDVELSLEAAVESHLMAEPSAYTAEQHRRAGRIVKFFMTHSNAINATGRPPEPDPKT